MPKTPTADTAQAFIDKYKSKRYTEENAGLCIILEYLYQLFRKRTIDKDNLPERLYPPERTDAILNKAYYSGDDDNYYLCDGMQKLMEWLPTAFDSADAASEAATLAIISAMTEVTTLQLAAYTLSNKTVEAINSPNISDLLKGIWNHSEEVSAQYKKTRAYIINNLCFVNAYNTLIEMISKELSIPEFINFKVNTDKVQKNLDRFNSMLPDVRQEAINYLLPENAPIDICPVEIPEENIKNAAIDIRRAARRGGVWSTAFSNILNDYWKRSLIDE